MIIINFVGDPPVDEVEILRGQVKLLHNQLLFERHKCDLHAIRNRRLIGKTFKAVQYQEELQATVCLVIVVAYTCAGLLKVYYYMIIYRYKSLQTRNVFSSLG